MSGELNTDNTDATGFSQMAVDTAPVPHMDWMGWFFLFAKIVYKIDALRDRAR